VTRLLLPNGTITSYKPTMSHSIATKVLHGPHAHTTVGEGAGQVTVSPLTQCEHGVTGHALSVVIDTQRGVVATRHHGRPHGSIEV
jgi:hypothetical protein